MSIERERNTDGVSEEDKNWKGLEVESIPVPYSGVCDVYSPEEARAMADALRAERTNPNRKVMIGVMTSPLVLNDDLPIPDFVLKEVRAKFPAREEMATGFIDDPDVFNTIHYADLYGPEGPWEAGASPNVCKNLELCVEYGGEHLHAIQIDVTWPDAGEVIMFKEKHPDVALVLQVGTFAFEATEGDIEAVVDRLYEYGDAIDYVLLDMSMGKGAGMDAGGLLPLLRAIRERMPGLGLAVAGGLGPDSLDQLEVIAKEFPDVSIDAQGNLKPADSPRDEDGHLIATTAAELGRSQEYIERTSAVLDRTSE